MVCVETRHAQRFLSTRPVKTDRNDARGIAEMMRLGHYRPVHVQSPAAQSMRTTLVARMQLVSGQLQIENTIRGLLRLYGLQIGAIHRNRFAARVAELLEMAAMPELIGSDRTSAARARKHAHRTQSSGSNPRRSVASARGDAALDDGAGCRAGDQSRVQGDNR